jgi:predicted metal-dependent phosphoesterase TrpH
MAIDLHLHTTASDGTFTPTQLVQQAAKLGLKIISVTDHDTVGGVQEAIDAGKTVGVEVIPGIELGSDIGGQDIHILGYFIDYKSVWLLNFLESLKLVRLGRAEQILKKLTEYKINLDLNEVLKLARGGIVTRAHIGQAMVDQRHVASIREAFDKYLGRDKPCYVVKYNYSSADVINAIKTVGGIPVLAHPGISKIDELIPSLVKEGLMGLEAIASDHSPSLIEHYQWIAKRFNLITTGGSDDHGPRTPGRFLIGKVQVSDEIAQNLEQAASVLK